jgi:hypothetical protein
MNELSNVRGNCLAKLAEIRQECERGLYYGHTRQQWEWGSLDQCDRKLVLTLAGVGTLDAVESLAKKSYLELTPPERGSIASALRSLRRLVDKTASLSALGAGVA